MTIDTIDAPLNLHRATVLPEWLDYNGHMNVAYYVLAFDHSTDALLDFIGFDTPYREASNCQRRDLQYRQRRQDADYRWRCIGRADR